MTRPNILLLLTDQHNPKISGFAGDPYVRTQNLDRLASRSIRFNAAVCASPVCTSSRMCMLTGKEAHRCAAWNNHWVIFPEHITWPSHFAAHGYRTCLVGKMHFGGRDQMQGFQVRPYGDLKHGLGHQPDPIDLFPGYAHVESAGISEIPESLLQDVVVSRETLSFALEHQDTEPDIPWFICASYSRPHSPFTTPGRYIRHYRDKIPLPNLPSDYKEHLEPYALNDLVREGASNLSEEQTLRGCEAYYACVDFVDDCIGELINGMEQAGLLENTIVIYTSDHGEMAGRHGLWGKTIYYEESVGVPLLVTGPGISPGAHSIDDPISLMDLFPTTCGLAQLPIPDELDGVDFSPMLANPASTSAPRKYAPSAYYSYGVRVGNPDSQLEQILCRAMRMIRERDWKYVDIERGEPLLFDMVNDPEENVNLANDPKYANRCVSMRKALFQNFSWEEVHQKLAADRTRLPEFLSGLKPSTPNQYVLKDGRMFDAEGDLYSARWLYITPEATGGIIPQQFG